MDSSIIRPENSDVQRRNSDQDWAANALGLKTKSPPAIRSIINKVLSAIGWGKPYVPEETGVQTSHQPTLTLTAVDDNVVEIGETQITNVTPLELPIVQTGNSVRDEPPTADVITIPIDVVDEMIRPTTPPSPRESVLNDDDNDPRIRITSREGIVEMEVRLPPRILSSHTEVADALDSASNQQLISSHLETKRADSPYHHVTQLSSEPAQMIAAIVKAQLVGFAMLPIKLVTLRLLAFHYLSSNIGPTDSARLIRPVFALDELSWRSVATQVSWVALCGALETGIDLSLWGLQYCAIVAYGKGAFGWGTL